MRSSIVFALITAATFAAASPAPAIDNGKRAFDWDFSLYASSDKSQACSQAPENVSGSGERPCSSGFKVNAAFSWKKNALGEGCKVHFYDDVSCAGTEVDWIDGLTRTGECKFIPYSTSARSFEVTCG